MIKIRSILAIVIMLVVTISSFAIYRHLNKIKKAKITVPKVIERNWPLWDPANTTPIENVQEIKIPKIIHRIWMVWDPAKPNMPEKYQEYDRILKDLHPNWTFMEWDDNKVLDFIKIHYPDFLETYLSYDKPVKRHDASRYLILNHFGGVFIQHSLKFRHNIEPLIKGAEIVLTEQSQNIISIWNGFIASIPGHPILKNIIDEMPSRSKAHILISTGPVLITEITHKYLNNTKNSNVRVLHHKFLLPFDWIEKDNEPTYTNCILDDKKCFDLYPDAYSYCLWSKAWANQE